MYPFERFTADAKQTLTFAQEEAERSHHSYIGTEHLLLGLLRLRDGVAYEALAVMGIDIERVRETIATVLGRNERIIIQQIIPTSRVKKVIEIAFEKARSMDQNYVNSGHLLMALAIEGEGLAAHVLADLGADAATVVATVERLMSDSPRGQREETPPTGDAQRLLQHPRVVRFMRGKDLAEVQALTARLAQPPEALGSLRTQLAHIRAQERGLRHQLEQAEDDWLREITE